MMWRWSQVAAWLGDPRLGAELGVKEGRFTEHMLRTFPDIHMVAVDTWSPREKLERVGFETYDDWNFALIEQDFHNRTDRYRDRLSIVRCDTVKAARDYADGTFDFVFIDAEHTYEGVRDDIKAWTPKLKRGGLLCGHDYSEKFPGVVAAVDELKRPITTGHDKVWMIRC